VVDILCHMENLGERLSLAVGGVIHQLRSDAQMTMEDLAAQADVHRTSVGLIERGERNLTVATAARIADVFGLRASELLAMAEFSLDAELESPDADRNR